ncbi:oye family NADH-dependent flavin oxidoreductase [Actinoplanes sp. N902-109]|uniref:oxidoreductase n=1 Tax=Actinoplanes sp. (strain N902-109) TaxID=649831 RepID=UPI000329347A|nr:oye family NADH-dependent flavin oxidoreductase [Actinoplanes sp. N902-109]AGL15890.1 oye family NADH-dependent flavin oxidoreductase [Actinoplanes sp. N902-109]
MTTRAAHVLDRPIAIGGLTVPTRVVMPAMTRGFSPDGVPGADLPGYFARRAAASVGLIITESTYIGHPSAGQHHLVSRIDGAAPQAGWARVVRAVHEAGGRIFVQLQHVGMARTAGEPPVPEAPAIGPSGIPLTRRGKALFGTTTAGETMTRADIDAVVDAFARAAADAERIGFDGVELHGAHGYLIDQFLWPVTNRRTDAYGGDARSRARFGADIIAAVKDRVTPGFPVTVRLSQWKMNDYDARIAETPDELAAVLDTLAGADAFHASARRFWQPAFDDSALPLAGWIRKLSGKPVIGNGSAGLDGEYLASMAGEQASVSGVDGLLDRMVAGEFDLISAGRSLLADPEWAAKVMAGRIGEVIGFTPAALGVLH